MWAYDVIYKFLGLDMEQRGMTDATSPLVGVSGRLSVPGRPRTCDEEVQQLSWRELLDSSLLLVVLELVLKKSSSSLGESCWTSVCTWSSYNLW